MVRTGFMAALGSWWIMAMSWPRRRRSPDASSWETGRPSTKTSPVTGDVVGQKSNDGSRRHRLPGARLADQTDGLPGLHD